MLPFDPADYLDTEDAIAAYLADARLDGAVALSRAVEVVARARTRMRPGSTDEAVPMRGVAEPAPPPFPKD